MKKIVLSILIIIGLLLQFCLWDGTGSMRDILRLKQAITQQSEEIARLKERNRQLAAEISVLKTNPHAFEERARAELGMIKKGETFCIVIEPMR